MGRAFDSEVLVFFRVSGRSFVSIPISTLRTIIFSVLVFLIKVGTIMLINSHQHFSTSAEPTLEYRPGKPKWLPFCLPDPSATRDGPTRTTGFRFVHLLVGLFAIGFSLYLPRHPYILGRPNNHPTKRILSSNCFVCLFC